MAMRGRETNRKDLLGLSRSRFRYQWKRRQIRLRLMVRTYTKAEGRNKRIARKWRAYRTARWLQVALWMIFTSPTWMAGWNMMLLTEIAPTNGHYIDAPSQQVEVVRAAEFREMDEEHPDLPDPEEPTTDGPWSDMVQVTPWTPADGRSMPVVETGF